LSARYDTLSVALHVEERKLQMKHEPESTLLKHSNFSGYYITLPNIGRLPLPIKSSYF